MDNNIWVVRKVEIIKIPQDQNMGASGGGFDTNQRAELDSQSPFQLTHTPPKPKPRYRWGTILFICAFVFFYWYFWNIIDV